MTEIDIPATITAAGAFVTAVGVIVIAYWSYRGKERASRAADLAADTKKEVLLVGDKFVLLDKRVDGRLTDLLKEVREKALTEIALARQEGIAQGEQAQRDRNNPAEAASVIIANPPEAPVPVEQIKP